MNPKGSPLFIFRHYATFSKFSKKNFQKKISKKFSIFFCFQSGKVIFQSYRAWKAHFGCLESVFKAFHEYILGIFRKLWAFWALDIAPTLDVPVLLVISSMYALINYVVLIFHLWLQADNTLYYDHCIVNMFSNSGFHKEQVFSKLLTFEGTHVSLAWHTTNELA